MSNKKKTNEAEQRAVAAEQAARDAQAQAEKVRMDAAQNAKETIKITPEAQNVLTQSNQDFNAMRGGDVSRVNSIANYLANSSRANATMKRLSPTGSASLAFDVANPNLIAMNEQKLNRQQAQDTALAVTGLAQDAEAQAVDRIGAISGMDLSARNSLASFLFQNAGLSQGNANLSNNLSQTAWDRYKFEKQQKSFLSQLALGAVGSAGQIASAAIGKK